MSSMDDGVSSMGDSVSSVGNGVSVMGDGVSVFFRMTLILNVFYFLDGFCEFDGKFEESEAAFVGFCSFLVEIRN